MDEGQDKRFLNSRPCNSSLNTTHVFSHVDVARNMLYVIKPFVKPDNFNVTICIGSTITTQILFNVFEEMNMEHINCSENK